mgnify:CR=1 FL=1
MISMQRCGAVFLAMAGGLLVQSASLAQLYTEDFDDGNAVNRWTALPGFGVEAANFDPVPMDTNFDRAPFTGVDGINDDFSGFAFDYSTVGIPSAPNSTGGSTVGLKLQASLFSNALGGFSASPNGLNLTGDYTVAFDAWSSSLGPWPFGGSGSTNLSTFAVLTSGTASNTILQTDGVFFAYTGDGGSSADFRAYSVEDQNSYQWPREDPTDEHVTYHDVNSRNGTEQHYKDAVGSPTTVPQSVIDANPSADMSGTLFDGAAGFAWHRNEIKVVGNLVEWYVNGALLITVDTTEFAGDLGGGNIAFGHADINFGSSTDPLAETLLFTLLDNIEVTELVTAADNADFDGDNLVAGDDFVTWQRNFEINDGSALRGDGDANGDGNVGSDDLGIWQGQFGSNPNVAVAAQNVPEPSVLIFLAAAAMTLVWFRGRGFRYCEAVPAVVRR